jgi:aromatic-amino-acid transaminase
MEGLNAYRHAIAPLLFGADHPVLAQNRVAIQTLGGSGALKVGADFLKRYFPDSASGSAIRPGKTTSPSLKGLASK